MHIAAGKVDADIAAEVAVVDIEEPSAVAAVPLRALSAETEVVLSRAVVVLLDVPSAVAAEVLPRAEAVPVQLLAAAVLLPPVILPPRVAVPVQLLAAAVLLPVVFLPPGAARQRMEAAVLQSVVFLFQLPPNPQWRPYLFLFRIGCKIFHPRLECRN